MTFSSCTSLTGITIPNSVETIGDFAFDGCVDLNTIYYNGTLEEWCSSYTLVVWNYEEK